MSLKSFKVRVNVESNTYRHGTTKRHLMAWALNKEEFTKVEFLEFVQQELENEVFTSKMAPETCAKAWWNEFYAKHKVFEVIEA